MADFVQRLARARAASLFAALSAAGVDGLWSATAVSVLPDAAAFGERRLPECEELDFVKTAANTPSARGRP